MSSSVAVTDPAVELRDAVAGRYEIERELGRGGMGVVYLARDPALDRPVAIKVLPPALAAQPELRDRFLRETRTAAQLSHPHIVPIHAVEEHAGLVFFVMGYIDGETLTERVQRVGPLPPTEAARILQEAAWALSYAHGRGVVHRDVKADNILIERASGRAFITDFGIARVADSTLTAVGESLGTPQYMSPEQATGEPVDARSDLYSLGIVGFYALTGTLPFEAPTVQAVLAMQVTRPAPPLASTRPDVPRRLAEAIDRCLLKDPAARWQTAEEFVAALQQSAPTTIELAPAVRSFLRMAEMSVATLLLIGSTVPIIVLARPAQPALLVTWVLAALLVTLFQVAGRARMLLEQGFGYEDVRAGLELEQRRRREEMDAWGLTAAHQTRRTVWRAIMQVVIGSAMLGTGVAIASRTKVNTPSGAVAAFLMGFGILTVMWAMVDRRKRLVVMERRTSRVTSRLWLGWFGRTLFRVAARARRAAPETAPGARREAAGDVLRALPSATRRELRTTASVIAELEHAGPLLDARERELERAIAGAGATTDERHRALVDDMRAARERAGRQRARAAAMLETLRLQLLRVRSGAGQPRDLAPDLEAARGLLGEISGRG